MNSQQSILGTSLGKSSRFSTLNRWTPNVVSPEYWNICTRKRICRFVSLLLGPCVKLNKGIKQYYYWYEFSSFLHQTSDNLWLVYIRAGNPFWKKCLVTAICVGTWFITSWRSSARFTRDSRGKSESHRWVKNYRIFSRIRSLSRHIKVL